MGFPYTGVSSFQCFSRNAIKGSVLANIYLLLLHRSPNRCFGSVLIARVEVLIQAEEGIHRETRFFEMGTPVI